jgi:hypothetical protein
MTSGDRVVEQNHVADLFHPTAQGLWTANSLSSLPCSPTSVPRCRRGPDLAVCFLPCCLATDHSGFSTIHRLWKNSTESNCKRDCDSCLELCRTMAVQGLERRVLFCCLVDVSVEFNLPCHRHGPGWHVEVRFSRDCCLLGFVDLSTSQLQLCKILHRLYDELAVPFFLGWCVVSRSGSAGFRTESLFCASIEI